MSTESTEVPREPARGAPSYSYSAGDERRREIRQREQRRRAAARPLIDEQGTAQALGWLSIGLGVAALLAPRPVAKVTGLQGRETLLRGWGRGSWQVASGF